MVEAERNSRSSESVTGAGGLAGRVGLAANARVWVGGHDVAAKRTLHAELTGLVKPPAGPVAAAFLAAASVDEAVYFAEKLRPRLAPNATLWVTCSLNTLDVDGEAIGTSQRLIGELAARGFVELRKIEPAGGRLLVGFRDAVG